MLYAAWPARLLRKTRGARRLSRTGLLACWGIWLNALFSNLPLNIQREAKRAYRLFQSNTAQSLRMRPPRVIGLPCPKKITEGTSHVARGTWHVVRRTLCRTWYVVRGTSQNDERRTNNDE